MVQAIAFGLVTVLWVWFIWHCLVHERPLPRIERALVRLICGKGKGA